jgi:hypothetical protein
MMSNRMTVGALLTGLTLGFAAQAAEPQAVTQATYAGVTVGIDPETGKLRPLTATESKRLSDAMLSSKALRYGNQPRNANEAGKTRRVRADGSVSIQVPADKMSEMHAIVGADGQVTLYEDAAPVASKGEIK